MRMFLSIIKNSLTRSLTQKFLAFLTVFLSVALIACMLNMTLKIGNQVAKELRSYGSNILVLPKSDTLNIEIDGKSYSPLKNDKYLKESDLHQIKEIFWRNNIVAFAPYLYGDVNGTNKKTYSIVGTYFSKSPNVSDEPDFKTGVKTLNLFWKIDGKYPQDDSLNQVAVGNLLAKQDNLKIGQTMKLDGKNVKIVGILNGSQDNEDKIIMSLKLAQILLNKPNDVSRVEVSAMTIPEDDLSIRARRNIDSLDSTDYDKWYCSAYVSSIAYQITEKYPGSIAKGVLSVSDAQSGITKKIQSLMGVVSIIALIVSSIGVTSLMSSEIYRRKKEIGLLKALGASSFNIYLNFCVEMLIVGIIASIAGAIFGYLLSYILFYQIFGTSTGIALMVLPICVVFGSLICIIGSLAPLKNVINLLPAEVLYGRK